MLWLPPSMTLLIRAEGQERFYTSIHFWNVFSVYEVRTSVFFDM